MDFIHANIKEINMKKILCLVGLILLLLMVLGCDDYTQIVIYPSDSSNTVHIDLPGHNLNKTRRMKSFTPIKDVML